MECFSPTVLYNCILFGVFVHVCYFWFWLLHDILILSKLFKGLRGFWRRQWHPTPALLPGKSHGWRSLVGCSPWGCWELDTTEQLHFHFSLSCIGEGNGNPLQSSCLENPRDGGAWWAAVYGVAQSRTRLKWLSSSSKRIYQSIMVTILEEGMATHSSILAWKTLWTKELGGLQSMGLHKGRHDLATEQEQWWQ